MKKVTNLVYKSFSVKYTIYILVALLIVHVFIENQNVNNLILMFTVILIVLLLAILLKKKKRDEKLSRTFEFIAQINLHENDGDFLQDLVQFLAKECSVKYALIDDIHGEEDIIATTVALFADGKIGENIEYELQHSPCENVFGKGLCIYKDKVQTLFPKDKLLQDMSIESYIGLPLFGTDGTPLGLIAVMDDKKIKNVNEIESLLQLVAIRAGFELEKYIHEKEINNMSMLNNSILESVEEGIVVYDSGLNYLMINDRMTKIVQMEKEQLLGKHILDVFPFLKDSNIYSDLERVINDGIEVQTEYEYTNPINRSYWFKDYSEPLINNQGDVVGAIKKIVDITSYKATEKELIRLRKEAESANLAKSNFLANMSHEIRTPMNGVVGMIELVMSSDDISEKEKYLKIAKNSALTLVNIVNDILVFSSLKENKVVLINKHFDIRVTIKEINILFESLINQKDVKLVINIGNEVPRFIYGDELRFKQIWMNLLGNALKFTLAGEITQEIKYIELDDTTYALNFSVKDTGIGISEEEVERIFERFHQSIQTNKLSQQGTGLGLSISRSLVNLMGGKLQCQSVLGEGSEFSFEIIIKNTISDTFNPTETEYANQFSEKDKPLKLLVVDDDLLNNQILEVMLQNEGFITSVAFNGIEAVALNTLNQPDIIFMDISMPLMNGYEAIDKIRKNQLSKNKPIIIAQTAYVSGVERQKCLDAGFDDYISKPIVLDHLRQMIMKHINNVV